MCAGAEAGFYRCSVSLSEVAWSVVAQIGQRSLGNFTLAKKDVASKT